MAGIFPLEIFLAILLGVLLCIFLSPSWRREATYAETGWFLTCVLFLLLTAVGVAGLRSSLGVRQSLDSRYGIYIHTLLLIFSVAHHHVEEFLQYETVPLRLQPNLAEVAIAAAIVFSLTMDIWGWVVPIGARPQHHSWHGRLRSSGASGPTGRADPSALPQPGSAVG